MANYYSAQLERLTDNQIVVIQLRDYLGHNTNWINLTSDQFRRIAEILKTGDLKNATH